MSRLHKRVIDGRGMARYGSTIDGRRMAVTLFENMERIGRGEAPAYFVALGVLGH